MEAVQEKIPTARERLLAAAEKEFLRGGAAGITVRGVTEDAGLSIAMVNYYFGSRAALVDAMLERRLTQLNDSRAERMQQLVRRVITGAERIASETVVRAFLEATFAYQWAGGTVWDLLRGLKHCCAEHLTCARETLLGLAGPGSERLKELLVLAHPHLPEDLLWWRWRLAMGAVEAAIELWDREEAETVELVERLTEVILPLLGAGSGNHPSAGWCEPQAPAVAAAAAVESAAAIARGPSGHAARALLEPVHVCGRGPF